MKDKEKQIEEMAKDLCPIVHPNQCEKQCFNVGNCQELKEASEKIYNLGYQKLPKDSVVLSREEYEKLKHYEWRVTSGVCMTQKEWFDFCNEDSNRRTCLRIEEREKERKETAEKILNELKEFLVKREYKDMIFTDVVKELLNQLAKQFSVEIKE